MKRITVCMIIVFILFTGLSFSFLNAQSEVKGADTAYTGISANSGANRHLKSQTDISMQDACELKSAMEMQMLIRTMPNVSRETRTSATSMGCGLVLLLAICTAIITGGRKSSLISILCIRLSFKDGLIQRIHTIYQIDGKKRPAVCL